MDERELTTSLPSLCLTRWSCCKSCSLPEVVDSGTTETTTDSLVPRAHNTPRGTTAVVVHAAATVGEAVGAPVGGDSAPVEGVEHRGGTPGWDSSRRATATM